MRQCVDKKADYVDDKTEPEPDAMIPVSNIVFIGGLTHSTHNTVYEW